MHMRNAAAAFTAVFVAALLGGATCEPESSAPSSAKAACGERDAMCRDAVPTYTWAVNPPLPTCCVKGTTCTFISRYSRCLKNKSGCESAAALLEGWTKWTGVEVSPFTVTTKILKKAGLYEKLSGPSSKTFFAPTDSAWQKLAKENKRVYVRFQDDPAFVRQWLDLVLVPGAVGNGGGKREYMVGRVVVSLDAYIIYGPINTSLLQSVVADWACTFTPERSYVYDTETVLLPVPAQPCA